MERRFFLIESFISNKRLWLVFKDKLSCKCTINSGICQNSILVHLFFFYIGFLLHNVLFKTSIWADDTTLNSTCDEASDLPWQVETALSCNLVSKIKFVGKYFYFSSATYWFWSVKILNLNLSIQAQKLGAVIQNWTNKTLKTRISIKNVRGILMYCTIKLF